MKKTLILGYPDSDRLGAPVVVAGTEVSVEAQEAILADARERHEFPKDIKAVEQYVLDRPIAVCTFISDKVKEYHQQSDAKRQTALKEAKAQAQAVSNLEESKRAANKAVTKAADKRNRAIAAQAAPENLLKTAGVPEGDKAKLIKQLESLKPLTAQASAEFDAVLSAANVIKNPKSTPEEITAAQAVIADPAKAVSSK